MKLLIFCNMVSLVSLLVIILTLLGYLDEYFDEADHSYQHESIANEVNIKWIHDSPFFDKKHEEK